MIFSLKNNSHNAGKTMLRTMLLIRFIATFGVMVAVHGKEHRVLRPTCFILKVGEGGDSEVQCSSVKRK